MHVLCMVKVHIVRLSQIAVEQLRPAALGLSVLERCVFAGRRAADQINRISNRFAAKGR